MSQLKYRPDIDGLRSIAILAVIIFHAFPGKAPGGFVGVDVFFVLSGFLISTIIFRQLEKDSFSLKQFYVRRIRRILPSLVLLTASIWLVGWFVLLPDEFQQLGKHIAGGNGFISNILLWGESGYFDSSSEIKPLLHLWSLGIEEQFYFLWPISLGLVWRSRGNFLWLILVVAGLSFAANLYGLQTYSSAAVFYLPIYRFWELMVGGLLAHIMLHRSHGGELFPRLANLRSVLGVFFIVFAVFFLDKDSTFPGWWALLPTMGTFLLITTPGSWLNRRVLGSRLFVYIGLISYPLYLWHWSILSFCHILGFTSWQSFTLAIVLSFMLAALTYEILEKTIKASRHRHLVFSLSLLSFLLLCLGGLTYSGMIAPRNSSQGIKLAMEAAGDWDYPGGLIRSDVNDVKAYVKVGAKEKVLFYGDSHMEQYAPRIIKLIDDDPVNVKTAVFMTRGGCPPIPHVYEDKHPRCDGDAREAAIQYALSPEIDSVVLGFSSAYFVQNEEYSLKGYRYYFLKDGEKIYLDDGGAALALQSFEDLLVLLSKEKTVYLVIDNPGGEAFNPRSHFSGTRIKGLTYKSQQFLELTEDRRQLYESMLELGARAGVKVLDTMESLSQNGKYRNTMGDQRPIFKDASHLRPFFTREYMDILDVTVRK